MTDHLTNLENHLLQGFPEEIETQRFRDFLVLKFEEGKIQYVVREVPRG